MKLIHEKNDKCGILIFKIKNKLHFHHKKENITPN